MKEYGKAFFLRHCEIYGKTLKLSVNDFPLAEVSTQMRTNEANN